LLSKNFSAGYYQEEQFYHLNMDALNEYIQQYPEQWQQTLDKYPSLKQMGNIGPDTQFVKIENNTMSTDQLLTYASD
jgi:hypothetical protein